MFEVSTLLERFPYVGLFLLLFLGEIGLPFPEDATLMLSGFLIASGVTKLVPTFLVVYIGLLITDFSLYWDGKKYGRKVVEHRRLHRIISPERLLKLEDKFRKWGVWVILLGRHIVGIRAQVFLVAGVMKMPSVRFVLADAISAVFTVTIMLALGYFGGNSIQVIKKDAARFEQYAVLVLFLLLAAWILYRYLRNRGKVGKM